MNRALGVWMNGQRIGLWSVGTTGRHKFEYDPDWMRHPQGRQISLSLPLTAGPLDGDVVRNYFDNLLPDSESIRKRIRIRHRLKREDTFSLLEAIGRDCVGAVQLLPTGAIPQGVHELRYDRLDASQIETLLNGLGSSIGAQGDDAEDEFRISIAGAQEKTALLKVGDAWCLPRGSTPTTHILKPPIGITPGRNLDLRLSVENEWLCNQLMHELKLPAARSGIETFGARQVLVVERFDRLMTGDGWIARLPQEDFCQAKGVSSDAKYESKGGPGISDCLTILRSGENYHRDGRLFLCAQLLYWLLAAIDGHAKNFSIFLLPGGTYRLTPFYDVLSAWPLLGGPHGMQYRKAKMAMAVRGQQVHYKVSEIQRRHWAQLAIASGVDGAWESMQHMASQLESAMHNVEKRLPPAFPQELAEQIFGGARRLLERFEAVN